MTAPALPHLLARVLRAPLSMVVALFLVSSAVALSVLAPGTSDENGGASAARLYEFAFLDAALLGAAALAVTSSCAGLLGRLAPTPRLVLEASLLVASTSMLLIGVLLLQARFLPPGASALLAAARAWPMVLAIGSTGVLLLRLPLGPAARASLLLSAVWVVPALLPGPGTWPPGDSRIAHGAEAPLPFAPILGCLLAAWLCLTRGTAHR